MEQKLAKKRQALIDRTARALAISQEEALELLRTPRLQSVRINRLKADKHILEGLNALGWKGRPFDWMPDGYTIKQGREAIRDSDLAANGFVYIQNAASWLPPLALDPQTGESILDVCAAPGSKTSHLAALADNQAHITANDNSRPRLAKLRANLNRLGVENVDYGLFDAAQLARRLHGRQFNKILLDAPCSGEGMLHFDNDRDFTTWSVAQIKRLQQLQRRILLQAWELLAPGGRLVYSTCTMAPEENEAVVDYLLRKRTDAEIVPWHIDVPNRVPAVLQWNDKSYDPSLSGSVRLKPSPVIEAFYVCILHKNVDKSGEQQLA